MLRLLSVSDQTYQDAFSEAIDELAELMTEREQLDAKRESLDRRIIRLREAVFGLGGLCGKSTEAISSKWPELFPDSIEPDVGLTDAIREVLSSSDKYLSPVFIRDTLKARGFDIDKYKNALASIHSVLKRLTRQGEVTTGNYEGKTLYKWAKEVGITDDDIPF